MKHLFDNSENNVYNQDIINLSVGAPGPDLLQTCCRLFQEATEERMEYEKANNSFLFQYGPTPGLDDFRTELAKFLSLNYGDPVEAENIILTAGASHGMHLLWTMLMHPNSVIIVDDVTYMIALESLKCFPGFTVVPCPMLEDGPDLKAMEQILLQHDIKAELRKDRFHCMYYTIPQFHNPTGLSFSRSKCKELVELSRKHSVLIACDDVYNLLSYRQNDNLPGRLFALDKSAGLIVSNGSFSKILAPGIRVGWIECPKWMGNIIRNSGIMKSGGAVNNYTSGIVATLLQTGRMQHHLEYYRTEYKKRMEMACQILKDKLNARVQFRDPKGGYFIWLVFPLSFDSIAFNKKLQEIYKVCAIPGSRFSSAGSYNNCLRICVVFHQPAIIAKGIDQLCLAIDDWFACQSPSNFQD